MINWIKSLFTKKDDVKVEEKPKASPQPVEFHVDRANTVKKKSTPDFNSMTKSELEEWAKKNLGLKLDRRKKKDYMIEQIQTKLKEK